MVGPDTAAALRLADGALLLAGSTDRLQQDDEVVRSSAAIWLRVPGGDTELVLRERGAAGVRAEVTALVPVDAATTVAAGPGTAAPSVWTSPDAGRSWTLRDVAPTPGAVDQRVATGVHTGTTTVLAGAVATTSDGPYAAAVWRSDDAGTVWEPVALDPAVATEADTSTELHAAAVVGGDVVLVGERRPVAPEGGNGDGEADDAVRPFGLVSSDGGRTWQPLAFTDTGPDTDPATNGIGLEAVVGVPLPPAPDAAPDAPPRFAPVVGGRSAQPEEGGSIWRPVQPETWTPAAPWALAQRLDGAGDDAVVRSLLRLDDGTLLAMQADGTVWASRDAGASWGLRRSGVSRCPVTIVPVATTDFEVVGCDAADA